MKANFFNLYFFVRKSLFDDILDRYLFIAGLLLLSIDLLAWKWLLGETYVFMKIQIHPLQYLALTFAINTVLAISAHDKEKEVGYLLLIGNLILSLLVLVLEIFYLAHL